MKKRVKAFSETLQYQITTKFMIWYDIFINCNWVVTRWQ